MVIAVIVKPAIEQLSLSNVADLNSISVSVFDSFKNGLKNTNYLRSFDNLVSATNRYTRLSYVIASIATGGLLDEDIYNKSRYQTDTVVYYPIILNTKGSSPQNMTLHGLNAKIKTKQFSAPASLAKLMVRGHLRF